MNSGEFFLLHDTDVFVEIGSKAFNLHKLSSVPGINIPPGVVFPSSFLHNSSPTKLRQSINEAMMCLSGNMFAVRSSCSKEDLPGKSFAGMYETFLRVGREDIAEKVEQCVSSSNHQKNIRLAAYEEEVEGEMSVLVQEMVEGEVSGVCFTCHPITGDDVFVVNAAKTDGHAVVSGLIRPEEVTAVLSSDGNVNILSRNGEEVVATDELLNSVLTTARIIVREMNNIPQDIEWTFIDSKLFILQSRPVTTVKCDVIVDVFTNSNTGEVMRGVMTPATQSYLFSVTAESVENLFRSLSVDIPKGTDDSLVSIYGYLYVNRSRTAEYAFEAFGSSPFDEHSIEKFLGKELDESLLPFFERRFRRDEVGLSMKMRWLWNVMKVFWTGKYYNDSALQVGSNARLWYDRARELISDELNPELIRRLMKENVEMTREMFDVHQNLTTRAFTFGSTTLQIITQSIPDRVDAFNALFTGTGDVENVKHTYKMWEIARKYRNSKKVLLFMEQAANGNMNGINYVDEEFVTDIRELLNECGHRSVRDLQLHVPRWDEDPSYLFECMLVYAKSESDSPPFDPVIQKQHREKTIDEVFSSLPFILRPVVRLLYSRFCQFSVTRDNTKSAIVRMHTIERKLILCASRYIMKQQEEMKRLPAILSDVDDIFFLSINDISDLLLCGLPDEPEKRDECSKRISSAKLLFEQQELAESPPVYVGKKPFYPLDDMNEEDESILHGLACSPGIGTGKAKFLRLANDAHKLESGDVLVVERIDPSYTPLFLKCSAVICKEGGLLSHGSICAREMGVPTVLNVSHFDRIKDGILVRVDGSSGLVRLL